MLTPVKVNPHLATAASNLPNAAVASYLALWHYDTNDKVIKMITKAFIGETFIFQ